MHLNTRKLYRNEIGKIKQNDRRVEQTNVILKPSLF